MNETPSLAEAADAIAAGRLSPTELARHCLERARALGPALNAFVTLTEERALADAARAEAEIAAGHDRGPLHGIPVALKDIIDTRGIRTTCQSRLLAEHVPAADATCAARLDAAGAVLMGKLTTHEFADGGPSFDLPWPPARNPWNTDHFTSGSSSGAAAALASGQILGAVGSDTGGSIRAPSACCGLAGLKPSYGRISRAGVAPAAQTLDHIGPMARTAEDCAILLNALAGHDPADPSSSRQDVPDFRAGIDEGVKNLRIGVIRHFHEDDCTASPAALAALEQAVELYRDMGARISEVRLTPLRHWSACGWIIVAVERLAAYETWARGQLDGFGERVRDRMFLASLITAADYYQAQRRRRELCVEMAAAVADIDVLLTLAEPGEAPLLEGIGRWNIDAPNLTMPFNLTGLPAISIPCGFGPQGLPLGLQLAGRLFEEATLLRAAHAYERAAGWYRHRPAAA